MSALGQKQTYAVQTGTSASPSKADMCGATRDVRFGPIAANWTNLVCRLVDYLVGTREQRRWNCETKGFCGLEIDDQIKFGWQLNGQTSGLSAFEDLSGVGSSPAMRVRSARAVTDHAARDYKLARSINR